MKSVLMIEFMDLPKKDKNRIMVKNINNKDAKKEGAWVLEKAIKNGFNINLYIRPNMELLGGKNGKSKHTKK